MVEKKSWYVSLIEFISSLFKKKPKVIREVEGVLVPPPPPIEESVEIPEPVSVPIKKKDTVWVYPENWKYIADPDGGKALLNTTDNKPLGVVIHHTATYNLNSTVDHFKKNAVDVHFVIGHDGKIVQMVQCNRTAAHAGKSSWNGKTSLNDYYIGIEVVNIGWLTKKGDLFYDGYNRVWKGQVREKKALGYSYWEPFTNEQEEALLKLCVWLTKEYGIPIQNIAAHFEVSPGRKNDPAGGLSMTFDQFRTKVGDQALGS